MLRSGMFWNLFLGFGLLIVIAVVLLGWVLGGQAEKNELQGLEERLYNEARLIDEMVRYHVLERKKLELAVPDLPRFIPTRITFIAKDGQVLVDTFKHPEEEENHADRIEVQEAFLRGKGRSVRYSRTTEQDMMYAAVRSERAGREPFVVRVGMPLDAVQSRVGELRRLVWSAAFVTGLLALCVAGWLARRTVQPLHELIGGAKEIAGGAYGHRVYAGGANEVGQLARTFNHMSERLAAQFAQIDEDRQQLRTVLSSMVEGVIAIDPEQRIQFANDRAGQLLEFAPRHAVGRRLWELIRQRPLQDVIQAALEAEGVPCQSVSLMLPSARSFLVQVARLPGTPSRGAVLVIHDNTELRRLERLRQEFVANVSHELKTPLAIIKACVETLIDGAVDDPASRGRFLHQVNDQSDRLHDLILDLLRLARIESETEAFTMEEHDLGVLIHQCLERRRTLAEGKKQELIAHAPPESEVSLAWVDEEAMEQILDNLVDNALKYTPEGGRIQVRWGRKGERVFLEVQDTGIGIPEAELTRIFERFYRVDKARSRELGGTGLGLSIVKHLVQAMQGTVQATSEVGKGTTFTIEFPALVPQPV